MSRTTPLPSRFVKTNYDVLLSVRCREIINCSIVFVAATLVVSYAVSSVRGQTIADVPIISDTFCFTPQSWFVRLFVNVAAVLFFAFAFVQERFQRAFFVRANDDEEERLWWLRWSKRTRNVGVLSAIGLAGLASIQKNESVVAHGMCAFMFMCGSLIWCAMIAFQLHKNDEDFDDDDDASNDGKEREDESHFVQTRQHRKKHLRLKIFACAVGALSMLMFVLIRIPPKGGFDRNYRALAAFEWIAVVAILVGVWSVGQDLASGMRVSVTWKVDANIEKKKGKKERRKPIELENGGSSDLS